MDEIQVNIRLENVIIDNFSIKNPNHPTTNKSKGFVNYEFKFQFHIDEKINILIIQLLTDAIVKETEETILTSKISFHFKVSEINKVIKTNDETKELKIASDLLHMLINLIISTVRGIFIEKTKGTILQKELLPIIEPESLLKRFNKNPPQNV